MSQRLLLSLPRQAFFTSLNCELPWRPRRIGLLNPGSAEQGQCVFTSEVEQGQKSALAPSSHSITVSHFLWSQSNPTLVAPLGRAKQL